MTDSWAAAGTANVAVTKAETEAETETETEAEAEAEAEAVAVAMEATAIRAKATKAASTSKSVRYRDADEEEDGDEDEDSSMEANSDKTVLEQNTSFTIDEQLSLNYQELSDQDQPGGTSGRFTQNNLTKLISTTSNLYCLVIS